MISSFISKHFPLPKFLIPSHIGLSFSDTNIRAILIGGTKLRPSLKNITIPLDQGVIVGGKIVDIQKVVEKLSLLKSYFGLSFVFFAIPDELAYIFQVAVPVIQGGDISEGVAFTIEENVPLPFSDVIFDFKPTKITKSDSGYESEVVTVACVKKEVDKFIQAITDSGLLPVGCVHESQAIANALVPKNSTDVFGIVHARRDRIGIYLVKDGVVRFATLRSITADDYKTQFLDEYVKFIEYATHDHVQVDGAIKTIFACGDFEYSKKVVEAIVEGKDLMKNAKLANVWTNILRLNDTTPSVSYEDSLNFAGPVGATLASIL